MSSSTVGVLGGGQLGRMLIEAASRLNVRVLCLDPSGSSPAKQISSAAGHLSGSFSDPSFISALADSVDVLTVEIEHVDAAALGEAGRKSAGRSGKGVAVRPSADVIKTIQDKYVQKCHLVERELPVADFLPVEGSSQDELKQSVHAAIKAFGLPLMLKSRTQAYDGKGNYLLRSEEDASNAIAALGNGSRPLYAERFAAFEAEIAVMVVKGANGQVESYDPVETVHKDSICHLVRAPLRRGRRGTADKARRFAEKAVEAFGEGAIGIFGVEMFLLEDGKSDRDFWAYVNIKADHRISPYPCRHPSHQRNRTAATQLGPPYNRSMPHIPIRESLAGDSWSPTGFHSAESAIDSDAQSPRRERLCLRDRSCGTEVSEHTRSYRAHVRQRRVPTRAEDGAHHHCGPVGRRSGDALAAAAGGSTPILTLLPFELPSSSTDARSWWLLAPQATSEHHHGLYLRPARHARSECHPLLAPLCDPARAYDRLGASDA